MPIPVSQISAKEFSSLPEELARLWRIPLSDENEPAKLISALRERIKELNCLYGVAQLAEKHSSSIEELLRDLVNFLPHSWQYPELACCRIMFEGKTYKSRGFKLTKWRQSSRISMYSEPVGEVTIFYLEECPPADEGPFLREERILLDALAQRIGTIAMKISTELKLQELNKQLLMEQKSLQEANVALRTIMGRIEEEKKTVYKDIDVNIDKIIMPILNELTLHLPKSHRRYAEMLRAGLENITSPFVSKLSKNYLTLTSVEVSICNMIESGLQTKEIAKFRGVSEGTINRHRENIRRKLQIKNSAVNLTTFLQSGMWKKS